MPDYLLPFCFALLAWWLSTGVILFLNHLRAETYRWSLLCATIVLLGSLFVVQATGTDTTRVGAMLAFCAAMLVWGWLEMSYFMGFVTGPRKLACPPGSIGWRRFRLALQTSLHHEAAVVVLGAVLIGLTWDAPNQFGTWTFLTLWLMRWSAKLNLYLGVPHINEHWFPAHLRFLTTYMRRRSMNLFFPVVITAATALMTLLLVPAATSASDDFTRTGYVLVATLLALGILEHWFMVLPLQDSALWNWALRQTGRSADDARPGQGKPFDAKKQTV